MVDFPDPDAPTIAARSPSWTFRDASLRTGTSGRSGQAKETLFNVIKPLIRGYADHCDSWVLVDSWTRR